jgi:hypothetical protein
MDEKILAVVNKKGKQCYLLIPEAYVMHTADSTLYVWILSNRLVQATGRQVDVEVILCILPLN